MKKVACGSTDSMVEKFCTTCIPADWVKICEAGMESYMKLGTLRT